MITGVAARYNVYIIRALFPELSKFTVNTFSEFSISKIVVHSVTKYGVDNSSDFNWLHLSCVSIVEGKGKR
jgi:hypothetical protein